MRTTAQHSGLYDPMPLHERLPAIRIPLRKQDPDVAPDLQKVVDQAYENGAYDDIDYSHVTSTLYVVRSRSCPEAGGAPGGPVPVKLSAYPRATSPPILAGVAQHRATVITE